MIVLDYEWLKIFHAKRYALEVNDCWMFEMLHDRDDFYHKFLLVIVAERVIFLCWICCIRALDSETYARELFEECVVHLKERLKEKERLREEEKVNGRIVMSPFI